MTDSPVSYNVSLDPREEPILHKLTACREDLLRLKQDKSTYIRSQDFLPLYEAVVEQVHRLNEVRVEKSLEQNQGR